MGNRPPIKCWEQYRFAPPYFFFFFTLCQKSREIYCTFLMIFSASGVPWPPTGVTPLDPAPVPKPLLYNLAPNIQNGSTSMMLIQVQNTSRASAYRNERLVDFEWEILCGWSWSQINNAAVVKYKVLTAIYCQTVWLILRSYAPGPRSRPKTPSL